MPVASSHPSATSPGSLLPRAIHSGSAAMSPLSTAAVPTPSLPSPAPQKTVLQRSLHTAAAAAAPGALASAAQTSAFMWLQTTVALQHRTGLRALPAMQALLADGGVRRLYSGLGPAVLYAALARVGDVGANAGVLRATEDMDMPGGIVSRTALGALVAAGGRVALAPLEAVMRNFQVRGEDGKGVMRKRVAKGGVRTLWVGSGAVGCAAFFLNFPFFLTVNLGEELLARGQGLDVVSSGCLGFLGAIVANGTSNGFRVVSTTMQTSRKVVGTRAVVAKIIEDEGIFRGLMVRGLNTRLFGSAVQGAFFVIVWKELEKRFYPDRGLAEVIR